MEAVRSNGSRKRRHLYPLYWAFSIICFALIYWPVVTFFNKPVAVLGLPLVYVWTTGVGLVWLIGGLIIGFLAEGYL